MFPLILTVRSRDDHRQGGHAKVGGLSLFTEGSRLKLMLRLGVRLGAGLFEALLQLVHLLRVCNVGEPDLHFQREAKGHQPTKEEGKEGR